MLCNSRVKLGQYDPLWSFLMKSAMTIANVILLFANSAIAQN